MFDLPYLEGSSLGPETVACMTRVCQEVRSSVPKEVPIGIQVKVFFFFFFFFFFLSIFLSTYILLCPFIQIF